MRIQGRWVGVAAAMVAAFALGCPSDDDDKTDEGKDVAVTDPGIEVVQTETGGEEVTTTGACLSCLQPGIAMRFSKLDVKEPSEPLGLPEFLNAIWAPDIDDSRLNIVLRIDAIEDITSGSAKKRITVSVGSAWHELTAGVASTVDQVIEVGGKKTPVKFYFLEGAYSQFTIEVNEDCTFTSVGDASLKFHPGPMDHGLICSAGSQAMGFDADTIPMDKLLATGRFGDTCETIESGTLRGCIARTAACEICSFGPAPDYSLWKIQKDTSGGNVPCEASYCAANCAKGLWVNFGGFVNDLGVPLQCDYNDSGANNGYLIAGDWQAKAVPFGDAPAQ